MLLVTGAVPVGAKRGAPASAHGDQAYRLETDFNQRGRDGKIA